MKSLKRSGFTLVEMMIVVAIIAVLAGIAVPKFMKNYRKSQTTEPVRLMKQIADAEATFFATHGKYIAYDSSNTNGLKILGVGLNQEGLFKNFEIKICGGNQGILISSWATNANLKVFMFYPKELNTTNSTLGSKYNEDYYDGSVYLYDYINEDTNGTYQPDC